MAYMKLLARVRLIRHLRKHERTTADRLAGLVQSSLGPAVLTMPRGEARGYIRAKITPAVRQTLASVRAQAPGLPPAVLDAYAAALTDRVVRQVLGELLRGRMARPIIRRAA